MGFLHARQMKGLVQDSSLKNFIFAAFFAHLFSPLFAAVQYDGNKQEAALRAELCEQQSGRCLSERVFEWSGRMSRL